MGHEAHYNSDGKLYIRKSMIEDFNFCPHRFHLTWNEGVTRSPNQPMLIGTRFHDFAYKFFDYCDTVPPHQWEDMIPEEFIADEVKMARWFLNYERDRFQRLSEQGREDEWKPIKRELNMFSEDLILEGTADRIDWWDKKKNEVSIIEYKTGTSFNKDSVTRQLAFYTLLWNDAVGLGRVVRMIYINPRLEVSKVIKIEPWFIDQAIKHIAKLRKAIRENDFPRICSEVKYAWCHVCSPTECGAYKIHDDSTFESFTADTSDEKFIDIYG